MKFIIAFVLALFAGFAQADTIGIHIVSHHSVKGYNNNNPGLYYKTDSGLTVGAYCNSESRSDRFQRADKCEISRYVGYTASASIGPFNVAATIGGIQGYKAGTMPMVLPTVGLTEGIKIAGVDIGAPRVAFIPKIDPKHGVNVVHLMWEREF